MTRRSSHSNVDAGVDSRWPSRRQQEAADEGRQQVRRRGGRVSRTTPPMRTRGAESASASLHDVRLAVCRQLGACGCRAAVVRLRRRRSPGCGGGVARPCTSLCLPPAGRGSGTRTRLHLGAARTGDVFKRSPVFRVREKSSTCARTLLQTGGHRHIFSNTLHHSALLAL